MYQKPKYSSNNKITNDYNSNTKGELWNLSVYIQKQWRTEGGFRMFNPPRNSEVLTKLIRIPISAENTSVTT